MADDKKIASLLAKYEKSNLTAGTMDPMDFMAYFILMDTCGCTGADAAAGVRRLRAGFIDYNDMRVARWTEVADALNPLPSADPAARRLRDYLNRVFDTCGTMSLSFFAEMKVTEAKKTLAALEPQLAKETGFPVLYAYQPGFPIPISDAALAVAKQQGAAGRGSRAELQKALAESGLNGEKCAALVMYWEIDAAKQAKPAPKKGESKAKKKK